MFGSRSRAARASQSVRSLAASTSRPLAAPLHAAAAPRAWASPPRRLLGGAAGTAAGSTVAVLNEETSSVDKELKAHARVIVYYTASWCGPCKGIAPTVNALSDSHAGAVRILKVDIDDCPEAAGAVSSVPTFRAYAGGKLVGELLGANAAKLTALVGDLASK